ncbi:MAG: PIG-L family deacetylase [Erythrobacter sp.]
MPRLKTALVPLALAALATPLSAQEAETTGRVLAVFAHPDDELVVAPALAALARQGAEVTIIHATDGDQGPGVSGLARGAELGRVRSLEAACAIDALGARSSAALNLGDGQLGIAAHLEGSPARRLADFLGAYLGRNDMVITWGPDGGYGHADHRIVSAVVTQLVQALPASERPTLLYPGFRAGTVPPIPELQDWAVTDPALLTERIAYETRDLAAARAATQCHVTQFAPEVRAALADLFDRPVWQGAVHFRRAF